MSDDLNSRKEVIEAVDRHTREDGTLDDDISVILDEVETAFNKEKVLEKLIDVADMKFEYGLGYIEFSEAINIVKKGGIE